ncbi:hypothetical protein MKW98_017949 [Papaver atlanticum]|uniref:Polygalacturonase n=1 Tax=Papaver atlanticum TaxID=357466 RepID=A0AAD4XVB0_9MAGN|nr:hypothetical protein MKW98_017949 [Papaver atlanticum]
MFGRICNIQRLDWKRCIQRLWIMCFSSLVIIWQRNLLIDGLRGLKVDAKPMPMWRPFAFNLTEFGGKGDGVTENTEAFEKAIMEISKLWKKGGGQLNVPPGDWLTAPFNLTSHMTLFLAEGATILGIELVGGPRYGSLIHGQHLKDVILWSNDIHISNITLRDSPFWTIHPYDCKNVFITNVTILAPVFGAPNTDRIDPDSCDNMVIEDCYISVGDDGIAIKSGWDQYGISYGRPSTNILIRNLVVRSTVSAGISIGSEMSGGVLNVTVENVVVWSSRRAMRIKTAAGFVVKINYNQHPDAGLSNINFINIHGQGVRVPVRLHGSRGIPLRNLTFQDFSVETSYKKKHSFQCSFVQGRVIGSIFPAPCENLGLHDEQGNLIKRCAKNVTNIDYDY